MGICLLLLIGVTYPLWIGSATFPAVPAIEALCSVPVWVDRLLLGVLILALVGIQFMGPQTRVSSRLWLTVSAVLVACFLLNQHRFQPWAYQFAVLGLIFGLASPVYARRMTIWISLSIYFYSAISKLNLSFLNELGSDFLATLAAIVGLTLSPEQLVTWKWLALGFPLFELATFALLLFPRTRKIGMVAACAMHLGLIVVLGPLGLAHSWGVLIWNVFFLLQAILLFGFAEPAEKVEPTPSAASGLLVARIVCGCVLLFPMLELVGLGDPWPAWGLYASHVGRTHLFLSRHAVDRLPRPLHAYVDTDSSEDLFVPVRLEKWSLEATGAPIYPGQRFTLAVARAFVSKTDTANATRLVLESPAERFNDERQADTFSGDKIAMEADRRYWWNTKPRAAYLNAR